MRSAGKRSIMTSKTTGRRYYLGRSSSRPGGRRYYVCSNLDCEERLARESDLFCRAHSESNGADEENTNDMSTKSDDVDENILNDHSEIIDDEASPKEQENFNADSNDNNHEEQNFNTNSNDNNHDEQNNDSVDKNDSHDITDNSNTTLSLSSRQRTKIHRDIHVDEITGARTFRDNSGRRRHLCMNTTCTNILKRQTDMFCRTHAPDDTKDRPDYKRYSAPASSMETKNRFRSPFSNTTSTSTVQNGTDGNHSEEYESPEKIPENKGGTTRSFRDASGRIRFLCSIPSCTSRVHRQAQTFCNRHQRELQNNTTANGISSITTSDIISHDRKNSDVQEMDVNHNNTDTPAHQPSSQASIKKRKQESQTSFSTSTKTSAIPANKIVIATTTLLDGQWTDMLIFLRQFPQVQLSTNLVVNDSTTHLLIDDSEKALHCTITKKIVQAAVRRHIFIISVRWITDCLEAKRFLAEYSYEILSDSHTTLRLSMQDFSPHNQYLFPSTYGFAIECSQCQGSINRNELIELIELTGAQLYDHNSTVEILIVLCDTNEKNLNKIKEKYLQTNLFNMKYVTSDFLLKSIIKFEIQDIDKYSL